MMTDTNKHEQTVLDKAAQERSERCRQRIQQILTEERCMIAVTPHVEINGEPLRVLFIPEEKIPKRKGRFDPEPSGKTGV